MSHEKEQRLETRKIIGRSGIRTTATFTLALWLATGCSIGTAAPEDALVPLVRSMADRLQTADQVALSKWDTGQAVYDAPRETQVIANVAAMAPEYKLAAEDASDIFADQIEASKEIQYALLNRWRRQGNAPATPRPSLSGVIRPALDKLQGSILQHLHDVASVRSGADCQTRVALAAQQVAEQMTLDTLHLAALDRAVARVCIKS